MPDVLLLELLEQREERVKTKGDVNETEPCFKIAATVTVN